MSQPFDGWAVELADAKVATFRPLCFKTKEAAEFYIADQEKPEEWCVVTKRLIEIGGDFVLVLGPIITMNTDYDEKAEAKRRVLAKLTAQERKLLGFS